MYSFSYLEPVCCSMSSSNCCFLICIQVSQEGDQVVWYSCLFHNFPQFIVIHTVKDFGIVNKAEIDVFSGILLLFWWSSGCWQFDLLFLCLFYRSPDQVGYMRQVLRAGALGRPRGIGWGGRWEGGLAWGTHVNPWLIHVNVWQKSLQYCKIVSLQLIKINEKNKKKNQLEHLEVHGSHFGEFWALLYWRGRWVQLCSSLCICWYCLSLGALWV